MSLDNHFELLPRPAKSALFYCNEATREILPPFTSFSQLHEFVTRLFVFKFQIAGTFAQCILIACLVTILIFFIGIIIAKRKAEHSFWIFRRVIYGDSKVLTFNAALTFALVLGLFLQTFVVFEAINVAIYDYNSLTARNATLIWQLPWILPLIGANCSSFGHYFACPSKKLPSIDARQQSFFSKLFSSKAWLINFLIVSYPIFVLVLVLVVACIGNHRYNEAYEMQQKWLNSYSKSTSFSIESIIDARLVWYKAISAIKIVQGTFIIYAILAFHMFIQYAFCSWRLISSIRDDLKKNVKGMKRTGMVMTTGYFNEKDDKAEENRASLKIPKLREKIEERATLKVPMRNDQELEESTTANDALQRTESSESDHKLTRIPQEDINNDIWNNRRQRSSKQVPIASKERPTLQRNNANDGQRASRKLFTFERFFQRQEESAESMKLRPELKTTYKKNVDELYKAYWHVILQSVSISLSSAFCFGISLMLGITLSGAFATPAGVDNPGTNMERFLNIALLFIDYLVLVGGSVVVFGLWLRSYEHSVFSMVSITRFTQQSDEEEGVITDGEKKTSGSTPDSRRPNLFKRLTSSNGGSFIGKHLQFRSPDIAASSTTSTSFFETHSASNPSNPSAQSQHQHVSTFDANGDLRIRDQRILEEDEESNAADHRFRPAASTDNFVSADTSLRQDPSHPSILRPALRAYASNPTMEQSIENAIQQQSIESGGLQPRQNRGVKRGVLTNEPSDDSSTKQVQQLQQANRAKLFRVTTSHSSGSNSNSINTFGGRKTPSSKQNSSGDIPKLSAQTPSSKRGDSGEIPILEDNVPLSGSSSPLN